MSLSRFDLETPAVLIDLPRLERNLSRMAALADRLHVTLRPHAKTHKCLEIGTLQQEASGFPGITVSTIAEAQAFLDHGFSDITWAFPLNLHRVEEILTLAGKSTLRLLLDSETAFDILESSGVPVHVWLKVDCGYHRVGVDPDSPDASRLAAKLADSETIRFEGILTHAGHSYLATSRAQMRSIAQQERDVMVSFAARLRQSGIPVPAISIGSTPTASAIDHLRGIDEIRPGNYVFFDLTQVALGSCTADDCALTVLASVVSSSLSRGQSIIDAGALALSKDSLSQSGAAPYWGQVFWEDPAGEPQFIGRLTALSQEHGIVDRHLPVGSKVRVVPVHSCLAAACFDDYYVVSGEQVVDRWKIWRSR